MARFHLSKPATKDLEGILTYIRQRNPRAAKRVKKEFRRVMAQLADMPHKGHFREDITDKRYRFWSLYSYLIAYLPETKPVEIVRVVHGAQDIGRFFEDS